MKKILLNKPNVFALVDDCVYDELIKYNWQLSGMGYAIRQERIGDRKKNKRKNIFMHKCICGIMDSTIIDHKDRDKLNNQRFNLRVCTKYQNNRNRSKRIKTVSEYFGVTIGRNNKFVAYITYKGVKIYFGTNHNSSKIAAIAYNNGIKKLNDPFIPINKI
jgi:hypothetical protein